MNFHVRPLHHCRVLRFVVFTLCLSPLCAKYLRAQNTAISASSTAPRYYTQTIYPVSIESFNLDTGISFEAQNPSPGVVAPEATASIKGTLSDSQGVALRGVRVTLLEQSNGRNSAANRVVITDSHGAFNFSDLAPGTYHVEVDAPSVEPVVSDEITLAAGETRELPLATNRLARKTTTVNVVATSNQVAQAQVQEQEQQRVLGFLPNYLTSYIWDAAPMTPKLKYKLAFRSIFDPVTFVVAAAVAGAEQWHNTFPGYGQEAEGYGKRFGATYADTATSRMLTYAVLPALFHQDPRYFYRGTGSIRTRLLYAIESAFICRGDNGQLEPDYSKIVGSFAAAGLSNIYRAPQDRRASLTFRNGLVIIGSGAVVNIFREFVSRKLTPNVPSFANGKP